MNYDPTDKSSIMAHALTILGKSIRELYPQAVKAGGRGSFGNAMEFYHFEYENNSNPEPDFEVIGYDLKCTPLDPTNDGYIAGERLVLTMIDFINEAKINHYTESHFWKKAKLLLIFYLRIKGGPYLDYIVQMIRWWEIPETDLKIIIDDWNKIHYKLQHGLAHELSESDTLYLGACTKSSDSSKRRAQFGINAPMAKPRAYCLKQKYMYWLVVDSYLDKKNVHINPTMNLSRKYMEKVIKAKKDLGLVVKSIEEYGTSETFEYLVIGKFSKFYNMTLEEIAQVTGTDISVKSKDFAYVACRAMLGVKTKRIAEFEKAGLQLKSVCLQNDMTTLKESMSFKAFKYTEVAEQEWEDSDWYDILSQRFLFVVFQKDKDNNRKKLRLKKVFFWGIPNKDFDQCELVWRDTKQKIIDGVYDNFMGISSNEVCHVRPHAQNAQDTYPTPQGGEVAKKCFWLNASYIRRIVLKEIKKEPQSQTLVDLFNYHKRAVADQTETNN